MKIAVLSPIHWRTPPRQYGPWELVASRITEGMVKRGYDVTLYATGDSETAAKLRSVCPRPVMEDKNLESKVYQYLHTSLVFEEAGNYDIIHNHYDAYPLAFSKLVNTPVVTTIHGFSSPQVNEIYRKYSNTHFVSISMADRNHAPDINYVANIYHGIPIEEYTFNPNPQKYFFYVGRISKDKGVHLAIQLARELKVSLKLAGIVSNEDEEFFAKEVKPNLTSEIEYLGMVSEEEKKDLLKNARAFLHLNTYPEGFGLTLVEAMASGTPVIGMNNGSVPEVVENGKTGFVVGSLAEAKETVGKIDEIKREDCRKRVEENFSLERMLDDYEAVYKKIVG